MSEEQQLSLLMHWEGVSHLTFDLCLKMPKHARFSFVSRLEGGTLEVLTHLTRARYQRGQERLRSLGLADQELALLRALSRLAHTRALISHQGFERLALAHDEAGRMLGGWLKRERVT